MDMRQPEQPLEPEAQGEEEDNDCYAACLTEDLQLFGQLNDLQAQDLLQLTNVVSANARNEREKEERFNTLQSLLAIIKNRSSRAGLPCVNCFNLY